MKTIIISLLLLTNVAFGTSLYKDNGEWNYTGNDFDSIDTSNNTQVKLHFTDGTGRFLPSCRKYNSVYKENKISNFPVRSGEYFIFSFYAPNVNGMVDINSMPDGIEIDWVPCAYNQSSQSYTPPPAPTSGDNHGGHH